MYISIGKASTMIGVSITTLRRWDRADYLRPNFVTSGGHRRYSVVAIKIFLGDYIRSTKKKIIAYSRVSSHDQKQDLVRQSNRLRNHCKSKLKSYDLIEDLGSGMNYKKKGLQKLLKLILSGQVDKIVLTHKDRLLRFGYELILLICNFFCVEVEVIEEDKALTDEQTLAFDVLEIITVFSARLYGKRSHKNKKSIDKKTTEI